MPIQVLKKKILGVYDALIVPTSIIVNIFIAGSFNLTFNITLCKERGPSLERKQLDRVLQQLL